MGTPILSATQGHSAEYLAAAAARRYTVKCHHVVSRRRVERAIVRGLPWAEAKDLSERLQKRASSKPGYSSWTGRLYIPHLEQ